MAGGRVTHVMEVKGQVLGIGSHLPALRGFRKQVQVTGLKQQARLLTEPSRRLQIPVHPANTSVPTCPILSTVVHTHLRKPGIVRKTVTGTKITGAGEKQVARFKWMDCEICDLSQVFRHMCTALKSL